MENWENLCDLCEIPCLVSGTARILSQEFWVPMLGPYALLYFFCLRVWCVASKLECLGEYLGNLGMNWNTKFGRCPIWLVQRGAVIRGIDFALWSITGDTMRGPVIPVCSVLGQAQPPQPGVFNAGCQLLRRTLGNWGMADGRWTALYLVHMGIIEGRRGV